MTKEGKEFCILASLRGFRPSCQYGTGLGGEKCGKEVDVFVENEPAEAFFAVCSEHRKYYLEHKPFTSCKIFDFTLPDNYNHRYFQHRYVGTLEDILR